MRFAYTFEAVWKAAQRYLKSLRITTTSCSSGRRARGSRRMSRAVIMGCSWRPKWECIQYVPACTSGKS